MWSEMSRSIQHGDAYIYFMLALAFIGTTILFERLIMLQFVFNLDFSKFLSNLKKMVRAEDLDRALNLCKNASHTSLPYISLKAIEAAEADPTTVKGTIEEEAIEFLPRVESRLNFLPALATLIFLVGILGTIDKLWNAFHSIDILDTAQKQVSLSHGIASSLTYTTVGLFICMIFLLGHHVLRGMAVRLVEKVHHGVAVLNNLLVPQEMAYVPVGAMSGGGGGDSGVSHASVESSPVVQDAPAEAAVAEEASNKSEGAEDATVEDIKDEEEII